MKAATVLKTADAGGQLALGKKYSGCHFEVEEFAGGELLLRPVRSVAAGTASSKAKRAAAFRIAEVKQVILPERELRTARYETGKLSDIAHRNGSTP